MMIRKPIYQFDCEICSNTRSYHGRECLIPNRAQRLLFGFGLINLLAIKNNLNVRIRCACRKCLNNPRDPQRLRKSTHPLGQLQGCPFHQGYQLGDFLDLKGKKIGKGDRVRGGSFTYC
jgi:hypothetical protein